jgi:betaine-homocysteine S-methyltransferase
MAGRSIKGLLERLRDGETVICAEGYLFELERRGFVQAGPFVPEVVLEHPEKIEELHREFVRAGSDVVEAFTYYAHRDKMRIIGREGDIEALNKNALAIAKKVAYETNTLFAGNICNSNVYNPAVPETIAQTRAMFEEQVAWAKEAGVDFVIAETIDMVGEAMLALEVIKAAGLPSVITLSIHRTNLTRDTVPVPCEEACRQLAEAGADVVGLNCGRGPATMLPGLHAIKAACPNTFIAALPVPYRTTPDQPTFMSLQDPNFPNERAFPTNLDPFTCCRREIGQFAKDAYDAGCRYIGLCCGAAPHHVRAVAESLGRCPPASKFSPDMSKHFAYGTDTKLHKFNQDAAKDL